MPYTYILTFKPTGQRYYGVKYAKDSDPSELWVTYFSSSKVVHDLIKKYGLAAFDAKVDRTFEDVNSALGYEMQFLSEIVDKENWLNASFGTGGYNHARIKTEDHRTKISKANRKPKTGAALKAAIENAKLGSAARRGQVDSAEVNQRRSESVSKATRGVPKVWLRDRYIIDDVEFVGMKDIQEKYSITRQTVINRLKSEKWPTWNYAE